MADTHDMDGRPLYSVGMAGVGNWQVWLGCKCVKAGFLSRLAAQEWVDKQPIPEPEE